MKFQDIPQFIDDGNYEVNMSLDRLERNITDWINDPHYKLQLESDFQRGHVWNKEQQTNFVEFFLRGGKTGRVIYFNKPSWNGRGNSNAGYDDFVIVDGLQRLTALRMFMAGNLKVFGLFVNQFSNSIRMSRCRDNLKFNINSLQTRRQVLEWYLQMNTGGVIHSTAEIEKVKALLAKEK
jgi:uncharacterized protein with ParB-like and HNH nuclease domain